ncbi:LysR substrate-binding domain-containing protein [Burkholderia sp. Ac-20349]|uniref:LysR substrate-binding domain-containing protein n=1 Tax=Burkholderia sp. Ac-20349 TaxID=2703893 RepID=UPI00197B6A8E|nr:LysR substrate-binding domain-containing protein [Burkholderia sp. Ac-20349]MBN3838394.1 LysR family transcriptional regulator [Burkholderia sp. Ac-20349]
MKDHHLKAWLALVETGSIRGAARHLHLSQAAVTKAIRELEQDLEAPLISRSTRGVTLTECGQQLTVRARLAQAQLTLARQDIRQILGGKHGHVSVAVTPMVFLGVLPGVIERFRKRMPLAKLTVEEGMMPHVLHALRDGSIDFAVAAPADEEVRGEFHFESLQVLETVVACRRGHPLETATEWHQLVGCTWVMNLSSGSQHSNLLDHVRRTHHVLPDSIVRVNTFGVGWNLMTRSDALLSCPAEMLAVEPYAAQACRIPLRMALPPLTLGILKLRDAPLSLAAETLVALFRRDLAD